MKNSDYNLCIPFGNQRFMLYNILNKNFILIDQELKNALVKENLEVIATEERERLMACGVILNDGVNEKDIFDYKYNNLKYSSSYSTFVIFPTNRCNLSCPYCYQRAANPLEKSMNKKCADKTVRFIQNTVRENHSKILVTKLFGGEPLLNVGTCLDISKRLFEWSNENKINYFGTLTTNGSLLSEKVFEKLSPYLSAVHITLDGNRNLHNKKRFYRNGRGTYDDVLRAISLIKNCEKYLTIHINLYEEHILGLLEVLNHLDEIGVGGYGKLIIDFGLIVPVSCGLRDDDDETYIKSKAKYLKLLPKVREIIKNAGWEHKAIFIYGDDMSIGLSPICEHLKANSYVIDASCDLYLCPSTAMNERYKIGKIREEGVKWMSTYYDLKTRNPLEFEDCQTCIYLPMCGGGCPVHSYNKNGRYHAPYCGVNKKFTEARILSYLKYRYPEKLGGKFNEKFGLQSVYSDKK